MTPAASHLPISRRTRLSAIRCPRNFRSQSRASWPKESPPYYDYPSAAHRRSYARRTGAERGFATLKDPASNDISRGWCRIMGLAPRLLFTACLTITRNQRITSSVSMSGNRHPGH